jgi:hypothetical protein
MTPATTTVACQSDGEGEKHERNHDSAEQDRPGSSGAKPDKLGSQQLGERVAVDRLQFAGNSSMI